MSAPGNRKPGRPREPERHGHCVRAPLADVERRAARVIGVALHHAMLTADVSTAELAAALGVHQTMVCRWLRGAKAPRAARLWQMSIALGVPVDHFVGSSGKRG